MADKVAAALEKGREFLLGKQNSDGSWSEGREHGEPPQYRKAIVTSCNALEGIGLVLESNCIAPHSKGVNYVLNGQLTAEDAIDLWAMKLLGLRFVKTDLVVKEKEKILKFLLSKQNPKGFWPSFPSTYNLTNYVVVRSIHNNISAAKNLQRIRSWLKKTKAKDGEGWGFNDQSEESEPSYTCNVVQALILAGENPLSKELQDARKFLERKQFPDGGWPSSKTTVADKPTIYGTAIAALSMLFLSDDINSKPIKNGIRFLLETQRPDGGWPMLKTNDESHIYITTYAMQALSFYQYLAEKINSPLVQALKQKLSNQEIVRILWDEYEMQLGENVQNAIFRSILRSNILGSTAEAVRRREEILKILSAQGELGVAGIIDELKKDKRYANLNKRAHMTLVKNDADYLRSINLVFEQNNKYFTVMNFNSKSL
jgi:prenyltransferase beta subunit